MKTDHLNWSHSQSHSTIDRTRKVQVSRLDVDAAGARVWLVISPVEGDAGSRAGEVLDRMAALGPRFRVGLQPSPDTRRWNFTANPSLSAKLNFDISGCETTHEILDRAVGRPRGAPISVGQVGEHLCFGVDHGVGDAHTILEIAAALSHSQAPNGFVDPLPAPTIDKPVRWATINYLKSAPRQVIRHAVSLANTAWSSSRVRSHAAARDDEPIVERAQEATGYRTVFVKSEPRLATELRAWRDATQTRVSVSGLVMWSIYGALRNAGIPLADECEVLVDLRRFLPDGAETLSNFFAVTGVHCGANTSYEEFCAELHSKTKSIGSLVKLVAHLASVRALAAVRSRRNQRRKPVAGPVQNSLVRVTVSDFSRTPSLAKIRWARPMEAELAVALPPVSASHLSIGVWVAGNGSVQATATFAASLLDTKTVRNALQTALTTENLRMQQESVCANGGNGVTA